MHSKLLLDVAATCLMNPAALGTGMRHTPEVPTPHTTHPAVPLFPHPTEQEANIMFNADRDTPRGQAQAQLVGL